MQLIIDRMEGNVAVAADAQADEVYYNLPRVLFGKAREGDLVEVKPGSGFEVIAVGQQSVTLQTPDGSCTIPAACACGVKAGDRLSFAVDQQATSARKEKINSLLNELFED